MSAYTFMMIVIVVVAVRGPIKLWRLSARLRSQRRKCCIERMRGHSGGCLCLIVWSAIDLSIAASPTRHTHHINLNIQLNEFRFCLSLNNKRDCAHLSATEHRTNPVQWKKNKHCGINKHVMNMNSLCWAINFATRSSCPGSNRIEQNVNNI